MKKILTGMFLTIIILPTIAVFCVVGGIIDGICQVFEER